MFLNGCFRRHGQEHPLRLVCVFIGPRTATGRTKAAAMKTMDHRVRVWVILGANVVERRMDTGFRGYPRLSEFGMMFGWQTQRSDSGGCGMRMRSLVFVRYTRCAAFSVIRKRVSSFLYGAQKNCLRDLWSHAFGLVRPQHAPGSGSVQRRHPHLSRVRSTARAVPQLWPSEARASRIPGRQPLLYQAFCFLCGAALCERNDQGCRPGVAS